MDSDKATDFKRLFARPSFRFLLASLYVGTLFLFLEYAIRFLDLVPPYTPQPDVAIKLHYDDPNGLVLLRPNAQYFTNGSIPVLINSDGYRDKLYAKEKASSVRRIAVLGDSLTMGDGIEVQHSYPKELEHLLEKQENKIEVMNFGITATNTLHQFALLQNKVIDYSPNLVLLGFNLNDYKLFEETAFERAKRMFGVSYHVNADKTVNVFQPERSFFDALQNKLHNRLAVVRFLRSIKESLSEILQKKGDTRGEPDETIVRDGAIPEKNQRIMNRTIVEMRTFLESRKVQFIVVILPAMTEFNRQKIKNFDEYPHRKIHKEVANFLKENNILSYDVLPHFKGLSIDQLVVSRFDPHFNRKGNAIIANAIFQFLTEEHTLK